MADTSGASNGSGNLNEFQSLSWRLGAWSDTTGYPSKVASWNGRIFWGNTPAHPRSIAYTYADTLSSFWPSDPDGTVTDAHGQWIEIQAGRADEILWFAEGDKLYVGTSSAVRSLYASSSDGTFGPRTIGQQVETSVGVAPVRPVPHGPSVVHASRDRKNVRDLISDGNGKSVTPPLAALADHIYRKGVVQFAMLQDPRSILLTVTVDGKLGATTVDRLEKVVGCTPQDVSGTIRSVCVVPTSEGDAAFLAVERTINGSTVTYIETLEPDFEDMALEDAWFVDCGGKYEGPPASTVTGATWLEGKEVAVLADGAVVTPKPVVIGGSFSLPGGRTASKIVFGLPMVSEGKTLRAPVVTASGAKLGKRTRVVEVVADTYETSGLEIVSDTGRRDRLADRPVGTPMGAPPAPFTGTRRTAVDGSWSSNGAFTFIASDPLPATVRGFLITLDTE